MFLFQMIFILIFRVGFDFTYLQINSKTLREFSLKLQTRSDNTVHMVVFLYKEQSIVSYPSPDPLPPLSNSNFFSREPSPSSLSSYHQVPTSLPPSPPLRTFCPCCYCNLEHGEFCCFYDQTFYHPKRERIIPLQNISFGTRHSPQHSIF